MQTNSFRWEGTKETGFINNHNKDRTALLYIFITQLCKKGEWWLRFYNTNKLRILWNNSFSMAKKSCFFLFIKTIFFEHTYLWISKIIQTCTTWHLHLLPFRFVVQLFNLMFRKNSNKINKTNMNDFAVFLHCTIYVTSQRNESPTSPRARTPYDERPLPIHKWVWLAQCFLLSM